MIYITSTDTTALLPMSKDSTADVLYLHFISPLSLEVHEGSTAVIYQGDGTMRVTLPDALTWTPGEYNYTVYEGSPSGNVVTLGIAVYGEYEADDIEFSGNNPESKQYIS